MLFTFIPTQVFAAGNCLEITPASAKVGDEVTLTYTAQKEVNDLAAVSIRITFDSAKFEVTAVEYPKLSNFSPTGSNVKESNTNSWFSASWTDEDAGLVIPANTALVKATLKVKAGGGSSSDFNVAHVAISDAAGTTLDNATNGLDKTSATVTITKEPTVESAIVLTAPASTTVAVPKSDTPNEIDLPTAAVYDQYGKPMTGTFSITYAIDGGAPTGVTLDTGAGKMKVKRTAQAGEVKVVGKLTTTAGTVTSDPVTYTITRETSKVTHVLVSKLYHNMPVPKVTEPGGTSSKDEQFTAEVLDQYLQEMTGQTVTWRVTDTAGNPVTGVSIDNTGKLTVTNEAPGIKVYAIATCQGVDSNNLDMTLHRETAKDTFVVICDQVGDEPETSLLIPTGTVTEKVDYTAKVYDQYGKPTSGMVYWELDKTYTGVELDTTSIPGSATRWPPSTSRARATTRAPSAATSRSSPSPLTLPASARRTATTRKAM